MEWRVWGQKVALVAEASEEWCEETRRCCEEKQSAWQECQNVVPKMGVRKKKKKKRARSQRA